MCVCVYVCACTCVCVRVCVCVCVCVCDSDYLVAICAHASLCLEIHGIGCNYMLAIVMKDTFHPVH